MLKFSIATLLFTIGVFLISHLLYGSTLIEISDSLPSLTDYLPSLATLLAAFLGAYCAFELQNRVKAKEERRNNIAAGNRALFTLIRQWNKLANLQIYIEPFRGNPGIHIVMPGTPEVQGNHLVYDVNSLSFLLGTQYTQLLGQLLLEEDRFKSAIQAFNNRSTYQVEEAQPLLGEAGIVETAGYPLTRLEEALGHRVNAHLRNETEGTINLIDTTVQSMETMANTFRTALKTLYPEARFISFTPRDEFR